ncbi:hypothetical protein Sjap_023763 [Stephania japonica]|uniref:Uncharacterized protein n=1 Tax=Stephania japonica TaxID=461633 RepID=A0AAP0HNA2_9MAGN
MTRLQRSSVSFRRQGSSGHIWEDHRQDINVSNFVGGGSGPAVATEKDRHHRQEQTMMMNSPMLSSPSKQGSGSPVAKRQRRALSTVLGKCLCKPRRGGEAEARQDGRGRAKRARRGQAKARQAKARPRQGKAEARGQGKAKRGKARPWHILM